MQAGASKPTIRPIPDPILLLKTFVEAIPLGVSWFLAIFLLIFAAQMAANPNIFRSFDPGLDSRRYSAASGFLLARSTWTIQAWVRRIFNPRWARAYRETLISMIGLAFFADGAVTDDEVAVLKEILVRHFNSIDPDFHARVIRQMVAARFSGAKIETYAQRMKQLVESDPVMLETTLLILLSVAASEGRVTPGERRMLEAVCRVFGIAQQDFADLVRESGAVFASEERYSEDSAQARANWRREQREWHENQRSQQQRASGEENATSHAGRRDDYTILNIQPTATTTEVKKAFRALALKYHPDRLRAQGIPPEMAERSNKRFREIKDAYERIIESRS